MENQFLNNTKENSVTQEINQKQNSDLSADYQLNVSNDLLKQYENVVKTQGAKSADIWLHQQVLNDYKLNQQKTKENSDKISLQVENQNLLKEMQEKYKDICCEPVIQQAIEAFIRLDTKADNKLAEQGFPEAMEYMSGIYKAGFESAMKLKAQNDKAKSRMGSSVNSAIPSTNSGKVFTRADIRSMDLDTFEKNEKQIFDQLSKGWIK